MNNFYTEIQSLGQVSKYLAKNSKTVLAPFDFSLKNVQTIMENLLIHNSQAEIYLDLPTFVPIGSVKIIRKLLSNVETFSGVIANNLYAVKIAGEFGLPAILGMGMTVTNSKVPKKLNIERFIASPQLSENELKETSFLQFKPIIFAYGYLKCMTLAHCPIKTANSKTQCGATCGGDADITLTDKKASFLVRRQKLGPCTFNLYNSVRHNVLYEAAKLSDSLYINALGHRAEEIVAILKEPFLSRDGLFTKGNFKRGVK